MFKSFWLYFYLIPVIISIFAIDSMFVHKSSSPPIFGNALEFCKNKDNTFMYSERGTAQDICIDEYMNAPWSGVLIIKIFFSFGFVLIIPLFFCFLDIRKK